MSFSHKEINWSSIEIIVHIGQHKTGTSTIQKFLEINQRALRNYGVCYPCSHNKHVHFAKSLLEDSGHKERLNVLFRDADRKTKKMVLSAEAFSKLDIDEIRVLRKVLTRKNTVKIVVYLKRQDLSLESRYIEVMKAGRLYRNMNQFLRAENVRFQLNYYSFCKRWINVFGQENVDIRICERTQTPSLVKDFLSTVSDILKYEDFKEVENKNVKPNLNELRVFHGLMSDSVFSNAAECMTFVKDLTISGPKSYRLIERDQALRIMENYKDSNAKLASEFLGRLDGKLFWEDVKEYDNVRL